MRRLVFSPRALAALAACLLAYMPAESAADVFERAYPTVGNGAPATVSAWPWMAIVNEERGDLLGTCGGTVLAPRWVLTAAHCFEEDGTTGYVEVGSATRHEGTRVSYDRVFIHEDFDESSLRNDIALVHLESDVPAEVGFVTLADAAVHADAAAAGAAGTVLGWGITGNGASSTVADILQRGELRIREDAVCEVFGTDWNPESQVCAGTPGEGANICGGDSGGPLIIEDDGTGYQVGIASFTRTGCTSPGVYTKVAAYRDWIQTTMLRPVAELAVEPPAPVGEGAAGERPELVFPVRLIGAADGEVSVDYAVTGGTATFGEDYTGVAAGTLTFPFRSTSSVITLTVLGDGYAEANETVEITFSNAVGAGIRTSAVAGAILNDDRSVFTLTSEDVTEFDPGDSGGSAGANLYFECGLSLEGAPEAPVLVDFALGGGSSTAVPGEDYRLVGTPAAGTLRFRARTTSTSETLRRTFQTVFDNVPEPDETVECSFSNPRVDGPPLEGLIFDIPAEPGVVTIVDDDVPVLTAGPAEVVEGAAGATTTLLFPVTLDVASYREVTVDYEAGGGTALAGADYAAASGRLVFAAGARSAVVAVSVNGDDILEEDETVLLTLANAVNADIGTAVGTGTIRNDDTLYLSIGSPAGVAEGGSGATTPVVFTVTLDRPAELEVRVDYAVGGTAANGIDYAALADGTLVFAPGATSTAIELRIAGDGESEPDETVVITLSNPTGGAAVGTGEASVLIRDDDLPLISIRATSVAEGASGTTAALAFRVELDRAPAEPVTVDYRVSGGLATPGVDYDRIPAGTLSFGAGETLRTITATLRGDDDVEGDETIAVTLSNPSGAVLGEARAIGVILDDEDDLPVVSIRATSVAEGASGTTAALAFRVELDRAPAGPVTVDYRVSGGLATPGVDYDRIPAGTLSFGAGETLRTITATLHGDDDVEGDETIAVTLSNPSGAVLGEARAIGVILDDEDDLPVVSIRATSVAEGAPGTTTELAFRVELDRAPAGPVTVDYRVSGGLATPGVDYDRIPAGTLSFGAGETLRTITATLRGDDDVEGDETIAVTLSNPSGAVLGDARAIGVILDDEDDLPVVSIRTTSVAEGASGTTAALAFRVELDQAPAGPVTVDYRVSGGLATPGVDYDRIPAGTLSFGAGETLRTITATLRGDDDVEGDETIAVTLSNPSGAVLGDARAIGVILDDDGEDDLPVVSIRTTSVAEGALGTTTELAFRVELDPAPAGPVMVDYRVSGGLATPGVDYDRIPAGTLSFGAGETLRTITATLRGDDDVEGDETITVTLSNPSGAVLGEARAIGIILDDDGEDDLPVVSIRTTSVAEGAPGTTTELAFRVELDPAPAGPVTVDYRVSGGLATPGVDYDRIPAGTLSFGAGETLRTITATLRGDDDVEGDETITVTLSNPSGAVLGGARAIGVILDDDAPAPVLSVGAAGSIAEGATGTRTALVFPVSLSAPSGEDVTASYTLGGTATAGEDYEVPAGSLAIPAGATSTTIEVVVTGDGARESDETVVVELAGARGAALGASSSAAGVIRDDDAPGLSVRSGGLTERVSGTAALVFVVELSATSSDEVTVGYRVRARAGEAAGGFEPASGTLTIPAAETRRTVEVPVRDDGIPEGDGAVVFEVGEVRGATVLERVAEGTIRSNGPRLSIGRGAVVEGASGTTAALVFKVRLYPAASGTVTVNWATRDGTATVADGDYVRGGGTLVFDAGDTLKRITVTVNGDDENEPDETLFVALSNASGATILDAEGTGTIRDRRGFRASVLADALVRAGRVVGTDVVDFVWARAADRASGARESSHAVVGGRAVDGVRSLAGLLGVGDSPGALLRDAERVFAKGGGLGDFVRLPSGRDIAGRTRFGLAAGGAAGSSFAVWGRGGYTSFEGRHEGIAMEGEVVSGTVGFDVRSGGLLAGIAVRHAESDADYAFANAEGPAETSLTSAHPYAHWMSPSGLGVWGSVGYGAGTAETGGIETDVSMRTAAAGIRDELSHGRGAELAVKADAFVVEMSTDDEAIADLETDSSRVRLALEGLVKEASESGVFAGRFEIGARHDDGDAERGGGVDAALAFDWDSLGAGLDVEGRGNLVFVHEDESFEEWSFGLGFAWDSGVRGRGFQFALTPAWGSRDAALGARLGYGAGVLGDRALVTLFGELGREREGGRLRLGAEFQGNEGLGVEFHAERRDRAAGGGYGVGLKGILSF